MFFKKVSCIFVDILWLKAFYFIFRVGKIPFFFVLILVFTLLPLAFHVSHVDKQEDCLFSACQTDLLKCKSSLLGGTRDGFGF